MERQPPRVFPLILCSAACLLAVAQFLNHRGSHGPVPLAIGQPTTTSVEPSSAATPALAEAASAGGSEKAEQGGSYLPDLNVYRSQMTYDGVSFAVWSERLMTELNPVKRIDGVRAMMAFGTQGFGPEATGILLSILDGYPAPDAQNLFSGETVTDEHEQELLAATFASLVRTAPHGRAALREALRDGRGYARQIAAALLIQIQTPTEADILTLVAMLDDSSFDTFQAAAVAISGISLISLSPESRIAVTDAVRRSLDDPSKRHYAIEWLYLFGDQSPREWARVVGQTESLTQQECIALANKMPEPAQLDLQAARDFLKLVPKLGPIQSAQSIVPFSNNNQHSTFAKLLALGSEHDLLARVLLMEDSTRTELEAVVTLAKLSKQELGSDDPLKPILQSRAAALPETDSLRKAISGLLPSEPQASEPAEFPGQPTRVHP